jgi:hypothetical protein
MSALYGPRENREKGCVVLKLSGIPDFRIILLTSSFQLSQLYATTPAIK